jgi:hypothetical protein
MGAEALIATLDYKRELQKALKKGIMKRKKETEKSSSNDVN